MPETKKKSNRGRVLNVRVIRQPRQVVRRNARDIMREDSDGQMRRVAPEDMRVARNFSDIKYIDGRSDEFKRNMGLFQLGLGGVAGGLALKAMSELRNDPRFNRMIRRRDVRVRAGLRKGGKLAGAGTRIVRNAAGRGFNAAVDAVAQRAPSLDREVGVNRNRRMTSRELDRREARQLRRSGYNEPKGSSGSTRSNIGGTVRRGLNAARSAGESARRVGGRVAGAARNASSAGGRVLKSGKDVASAVAGAAAGGGAMAGDALTKWFRSQQRAARTGKGGVNTSLSARVRGVYNPDIPRPGQSLGRRIGRGARGLARGAVKNVLVPGVLTAGVGAVRNLADQQTEGAFSNRLRDAGISPELFDSGVVAAGYGVRGAVNALSRGRAARAAAKAAPAKRTALVTRTENVVGSNRGQRMDPYDPAVNLRDRYKAGRIPTPSTASTPKASTIAPTAAKAARAALTKGQLIRRAAGAGALISATKAGAEYAKARMTREMQNEMLPAADVSGRAIGRRYASSKGYSALGEVRGGRANDVKAAVGYGVSIAKRKLAGEVNLSKDQMKTQMGKSAAYRKLDAAGKQKANTAFDQWYRSQYKLNAMDRNMPVSKPSASRPAATSTAKKSTTRKTGGQTGKQMLNSNLQY